MAFSMSNVDLKFAHLKEEAEKYVEKIRAFTAKVETIIRSDETSWQALEGAMQRAPAWFYQPLPDISDGEQGASVNVVDSMSLERLKSEISELKADNKRLTEVVSKETEKNETQKKKIRELETKVKNLETKVQQKVDAGATCSSKGKTPKQAKPAPKLPVAVEFPGTTVQYRVELVLKENVNFPHPANLPEITDAEIFSYSNYLWVMIAEHRINSSLKCYDFDGRCTGTHFQGERKKIKMVNLSSSRALAFTSGSSLLLKKYEVIYDPINMEDMEDMLLTDLKWYKPKTIYTHESDIDALTAFDRTIAVAVKSNVLLMDTEGKVHKPIKIRGRVHSMCAATDTTLVICDAAGAYTLDIMSESPAFIEVPQIKSACSVSALRDGYFFVCGSNSLYLLGPDSTEVRQVWNLNNQLRKEDQVLHVAVNNYNCVCVTKLGSMLRFTIKAEVV